MGDRLLFDVLGRDFSLGRVFGVVRNLEIEVVNYGEI